MAALYNRFILERKTSAFVILLALLAFCWLFAGLTPLFTKMNVFSKIVDVMPKATLSIFSGGNVEEMFTIQGFFAHEYFELYWMCVIGGWTIAAAGSLLGRELERGTVEPMLSQPVSRSAFYLARAGALFSAVAAMLALNALMFYIFGMIYDFGIKPLGLLYISLSGLAMFMFFAGLTVLATLFIRERGRSISLVVTVMAVSFLMNGLASLDTKYEWMQKATIFGYYRPYRALMGHLDAVTLVPAVLALLFFSVSWYIFSKKDLAT